MNTNQAEQGSPEATATNLDDPLNSQEFYELMQRYRHWPAQRVQEVLIAFENVKTFIRERVRP